jgi:hypothetical protein
VGASFLFQTDLKVMGQPRQADANLQKASLEVGFTPARRRSLPDLRLREKTVKWIYGADRPRSQTLACLRRAPF